MCDNEQTYREILFTLRSQTGLECNSTSLCAPCEGKVFMTKKDEYVAKMKSKIDDLDAQLDALTAKSNSAKKELQAKYKQEMADLRAQSSEASAKLDEIMNAGEDVWENMVEEMEKIGDAFKHSYNYFKSQF